MQETMERKIDRLAMQTILNFFCKHCEHKNCNIDEVKLCIGNLAILFAEFMEYNKESKDWNDNTI